MARHQGQQGGAIRAAALCLVAAALAAGAAAWTGWRGGSPAVPAFMGAIGRPAWRGKPSLKVTGTVTLASHLQGRKPGANSVLYVVAKNSGGVPVASRRIVNPIFPVFFTLDSGDLLLPAAGPLGPLRLEVELNTHGNVGNPVPGDLRGVSREAVRSVESAVHIVVDREV